MSNYKLTQILINLGLKEKEAKVYLTSIGLGPATILEIAKSASLIRTTVYTIAESLKEKGLMNVELKGWKKLYIAESPEKLEQLLEIRKQDFQKNLPEFMSLYTMKESESNIRLYEGREAVRSVFDSQLKLLQPNEDYMCISDQDRWLSLDEEYYLNFIKQRAKLNVNIRLLLKDTPSARKFILEEKNYNEKIKLLPSTVSFHSDLVITSQRTIIQQLKTPTSAMVIENKSIAQMNKEIFDLLWGMIR